jgi:spore coat protein JB
MMNMQFANEQEKLLHDIGVLSFVVTELSLYLDTHPTDRKALEYFRHYNRLANQARQEYSTKYTPLTISCVDTSECNDWQWALSPMPWEGGCN